MEVLQSTKKITAIKSKFTSIETPKHSNDPVYKVPISMYTIPPTEQIVVEDFERFALDRVKVLKEIDNAKIRGIKGQEFKNRIDTVIRKHLPVDDVRKDVISHFSLRLAYCRPADRSWFLTQETALLKHRLQGNSTNIQTFIKENKLDHLYYRADNTEIEQVKNLISAASPFNEKEGKVFYKVRFEEALELVRHRKVYLQGGYAYIHEKDFGAILIARFRASLAESLVAAFKAHSHLMSKHDSVSPILNHISTMYMGSDYQPNTAKRVGKVDPTQIDMLSKRSFPMCMKNLHEKLREHHHLKHVGRMQYGLFLKGIGLSLEDALIFWRSEFTKIMGVDKFDKDYSYNIRHNYGKEGKRTDYTPYSCIKIIMGTVNPGDHHGCPFKHFDADHLKHNMIRQGASESGVKEVLQLVTGGHYQIACRKHFELTHANAPSNDLIINHPNQYFEESEKYYNGDITMPQSSSQPSMDSVKPNQQNVQVADDPYANDVNIEDLIDDSMP